MDKLKALTERCKFGVYVNINEHRDYYTTAAEYLEDETGIDSPPEIHPDVRAKMVETDTVIKVICYPDTPIGSYEIWHHDLDLALDLALACVS